LQNLENNIDITRLNRDKQPNKAGAWQDHLPDNEGEMDSSSVFLAKTRFQPGRSAAGYDFP
jgi:hypothetical protein